jgi:hypothetical protein
MHGKKSVAEVMTLMAFGMEVKNWFVKKKNMEKTLKSKGMVDRHGEAKTPAKKTMCGKKPRG